MKQHTSHDTSAATPAQRADVSRADSAAGQRRLGRLRELDGLRGIAALIVVLHHTFLLNPLWPGTAGAVTTNPTAWVWWLSYTPLKLFTAGWESVMIFFVLSGLVITLPVLARPGFNWLAYYPRRITRLMIPVIGSVILAAVWVSAIPQITWQPHGTWFSHSSTPHFSWEYIVRAFDLFGGDGQINNPLWSLRWELLFSLVLPVFVILAVALRRRWVWCAVGTVVLVWLGLQTGSGSLSYLPAFFVGALLATRLEDIRGIVDRINLRRIRHLIWPVFLLTAAMLLIGSWLTGPLPSGLHEITTVLRSFTPIAACMLIIGCIGWLPLHRLLLRSPFQFIGKISFSLYLCHVPILIFTMYLLAGQPLITVQIIGIILALAISTGFWWLLESRSHLIAKRVGAWAAGCWESVYPKHPHEPDRAAKAVMSR